ncbi:MAG: LacI family transcriptional regulator [Lachnospiraceae bacterium]|nr:LacI family transcriptional regulator [Lachnospiraceae bacterium]
MSRYTIKDIAKICGVGTSTVSRAINNDPGVNEKTKERVLEAVRKYHYIPNNSAVNLKKSESNNVAVLVKGRNNPFFQSMYSVFETELQKHEYTFTMREVGAYEDEMRIAQELIREKRLKGIIFLGGMVGDVDEKLEHIDIPSVLCTVAVTMESCNHSLVAIDDVKESEKVVNYLIRQGHKKIAMITGVRSDSGIGALRLKGYEKALDENGIEFDENLIINMDDDIPDYSYENGYVVTKKLLESGHKFSALFAASDTTAFGAYRAILESGKRIPEDISVVGFDGIDMANFMYPSLTTIKQPGERMAKEAVRLLHDEIEGNSVVSKTIFSADLLENESVKNI